MHVFLGVCFSSLSCRKIQIGNLVNTNGVLEKYVKYKWWSMSTTVVRVMFVVRCKSTNSSEHELWKKVRKSFLKTYFFVRSCLNVLF